jgi:hypothetical protein
MSDGFRREERGGKRDVAKARSSKPEARSLLVHTLQSMRRDVRCFLIRQHSQNCATQSRERVGDWWCWGGKGDNEMTINLDGLEV